MAERDSVIISVPEAIEEYKKASQIDPKHPMARMNAGVVYAFDLGRNQDAVTSFEKYLELAPNAPNADQIRQEINRLKGMK